MEITEIQRYQIALERLKQLSDIKLGKPLLIQTLMGNLRVLHSNHIGYFKYISTKKSWEIALTDGAFVRLKGNLRAKIYVHIMTDLYKSINPISSTYSIYA